MLEDDLPLILNHKSICCGFCGCIQYHQTQDLEDRLTRTACSVFWLVEAREVASIYNKT
jgi:hypothetical protein